ncbi:hypothetical protein D3C84_949350 [compost metagenome]
MLTQMPDHLTAHHPVIEVVVGQDQFRCLALQGCQRGGFISGDHHVAAPLPQQRTHAFKDADFVVQHQQSPPWQRVARTRLGRGLTDRQRDLMGNRHVDAEHRTPPWP